MSLFKKAAVATSLYFITKGVYRYLKEQQYTFRYKVVLITGASRGLGLVMARQLAKEGANLCICARDKKELEVARHELEKIGAKAQVVTADLTDPAAATQLIESTLATFGRIDVVINNAGDILVGPLKSNTQEHFDRLMQLHFYAPLRIVDAALPHLRKTNGRILNISSIGGKVSAPHLLPYSASKFALTGFSEGLYIALKQEGITVTTVCPGLMRTGSPRNVEVVGQQEKEYRWFKISDSLPLLSMDADTAARKLLNACRRGDPEYVLTLPAKALVLLHGINASFVIRMAELMNRWVFPEPVAHAHEIKGYETAYEYENSPFTRPTDDAARNNNQF